MKRRISHHTLQVLTLGDLIREYKLSGDDPDVIKRLIEFQSKDYLVLDKFEDLEDVNLDGWSVEPNDDLNFTKVNIITRYGSKKS